MRNIILFFCMIVGGIAYADSSLIYTGSTPSTGQSIESLEEIILNFDFSNVIETYGENESWGVGYSGYEGDDEFPEMSVRVYKGDAQSGELLTIGYTNVCKPNNAAFETGQSFKLSFPDIPVESGVQYTLVITERFYAGLKGEKKFKTDTELNFAEAPFELVFYGGSDTKKILSLESNSIEDGIAYESMPEVKVSFNYDVSVKGDSKVSVYEGNSEVECSSSIFVDPTDSKAIWISFSELTLYNGRTYTLLIPEGIINVDGEEDIVNQEIEIPIKGASYRYFGVGRVRPSNGSETIMDEITIPFKFPTAEDKTYGFVNVDNGNKKWYIHIYEGSTAEGDELMSLAASKIGDDNQSLVFRPNYALKPATEYTLVIPEGEVLAYEIGAPRETYLKDYISERVELHYTTPSVEELPKWTPSPVNIKDNEEISELTYFIIDCPEYEYNGTVYNTTFNQNVVNKGILYLVTSEGDQEITSFPITRMTLDADSEVGNGELVGRYFVGQVNESLYEGNQYRLVWNANSVIVNNAFLGQYVGNPEIAVSINGATPIINDFGLKANVEDRLHSHADVFSFVTESEIKAGEGATMKLMDGEESVAEAPVYVAREANGYRAYADFGGKKLDAGKSYDVVLPEGSVYAANGIVNNPEIKSSLTAMPETPAAPEYVSVALNIDDYASATYRMVKGEESVLDLKAGNDWKLDTLTLNGDDVTSEVDENGLYSLPALNEDAKLDATYAYAHEINYDYETGVGSVEDLPYALSKDGSHLIISGLNGGENIAVYTVGGMKVTELPAVPADMSKASIALPEGQVYIILINGTSIKWKH